VLGKRPPRHEIVGGGGEPLPSSQGAVASGRRGANAAQHAPRVYAKACRQDSKITTYTWIIDFEAQETIRVDAPVSPLENAVEFQELPPASAMLDFERNIIT